MSDENPGLELPWEKYDGLAGRFSIQSLLDGGAVVRGGIKVKDHVQRFANDLQDEVGVSNFGTYNGHSPPEGPTQALDIFTPDNQAGYRVQDAICDFAIKHQKKYGVRYCIRRTRIWNIERAAEGWRQQSITGNRTVDHYDHVHVTFYARAEEVPDTPTKPNPINKGSVMSLVGRYVWGGLDWVFDGPSRIHAPVGDQGVLDICDKRKMDEWGAVSDSVHGWFKDVASMWGQDHD